MARRKKTCKECRDARRVAEKILGKPQKENATLNRGHYARLCTRCGKLWMRFREQWACSAAEEEIEEGGHKFHDWDKASVSAKCDGKWLEVQVWNKGAAKQTRQRLKRLRANAAKWVKPKDEKKKRGAQWNAETRDLCDQLHAGANSFANAVKRMPVRADKRDLYNVRVAYAYWRLFTKSPLAEVIEDPQTRVGEMGPHTPKPEFHPSQPMLALAAAKFQGSYRPLDQSNRVIMSLLGWHEWSRRERDLAYSFEGTCATDWLSMGLTFPLKFDLLIAPHIAEDFAFWWYWRERENAEKKRKNGHTGYSATYPYNEMYQHEHRAKVHNLRLIEHLSDKDAYGRLQDQLSRLAENMRDAVRIGGYVIVWQYPPQRLLATGLWENAVLEMALHAELVDQLEELQDKQGRDAFKNENKTVQKVLSEPGKHIPFAEAIVLLRRTR